MRRQIILVIYRMNHVQDVFTKNQERKKCREALGLRGLEKIAICVAAIVTFM